jgi:signal transduction histidine kinase/AmiR/NasT family two-component response regulator
MLSLHLPTIFAFTLQQSLSLGALLIWLSQRDGDQPALASWGAGRLVGAMALPLLAARGLIPQWASLDVAIALVCLGYGLTWAGARQFEGLRARPLGVVAGAALWLLACRIPALYGNLPARVGLIGFILAAYTVLAALEFHRGQARSPLPIRPVVVLLLGIAAAIYAVCGPIAVFVSLGPSNSGLPTAMWFGVLMSLCVALMANTTILLVAMTKEQTELRSTAALAAARDVANAASEQKSRFLARMSHELRTPLNGILGLAQVLAGDPELGDRQRGQAATLEQAGRHLLAILNEVLDLSRIESGRLELSLQAVALREFLRETLVFVHDSALAKDIELTLQAKPGLPETVLADPMRLRQILLNLLNNALKFTPSGGRVTVEVASGDGDAVSMAVTDTGPGVPASLRPQLFEPYTQAEGQSASGGSGLGLAISAMLARAMGGALSHADAPLGIGSRFTLVVPLAETAPAVVVPAAPTPLPPRGLRILVVDDIALNRMTARALLQHAGHDVEEAEDGAAAIAALTRAPLPDIVLMDQSMPDMDGQSVARRIRAMAAPAGLVPILAVTANALPEDAEASLDAGMDGHVAKPIELKALLPAITRALERRGSVRLVADRYSQAGSDLLV